MVHNYLLCWLFFFQEILWSAETSEQIDSLHTGQPQQVHGHRQCSIHRWVPAWRRGREDLWERQNLSLYLLGTSNWSGDYFVYTGGVSITVNQTDQLSSSSRNSTIQQQLAEIFLRDWESRYSHSLAEILSRYPDQQWHHAWYFIYCKLQDHYSNNAILW